MVDFGNTCALVCRVVVIVVLLLGIVLSCQVVPSCQFIAAVTHNEETHGVGLQTFENQGGDCEPHNAFVVENYNGMEMAAKVGGYVAPTCASLAVLLLLFECCRADGLLCGKCLPGLLLLGALVSQGLTFLLFRSTLFCDNKDIARCDMGATGYRSIHAGLVYAFCAVLFFCGPAPRPFSPPSHGKKNKKRRKKDKDKVEPDKGEDWTKEMYERRRKERNVKGRGVSGRRKEEIMEDKNGGRRKKRRGDDDDDDDSDGRRREGTLALYDPGSAKRGGGGRGGRRPSSPEKYDDYVDTDPDGMDWSAYTPDRREAYHERQRRKKKEKRREKDRQRDRQREDARERLREWERGRGIHADHSRDGRPGGGDSYTDDGYDDGRRRDSFYSERDRDRGKGYEQSPYGDGRDDGGRDYYGDSYRDSFRTTGDDSYYSRSPGGRGDDYSYAQDSYSYAQDSYAYGDDPPGDDSYYDRKDGGRSGGGRGSKRRSNDESFSTYDDSYDRRGYRDDPSYS